MIDLATGSVAGAEALLRVRHPVEGILSPRAVWAALDAPKVGKVLTDQILSLVLADVVQWGAWPEQLGSISVNLSAEALMQDGLADSLLQKLDRKALEPRLLTVEITERVLVDELAPRTRKCLEQLQRHGVRVSLDDFGTGFASLTHLQRLPVDEIKIDKSFVKDLGKGRSGTAIVKSMIHLGRNMGVDVVAEGVETAEQAELLKEWGCRFAQGYYFHRPMPASEFGPIWRTVMKGA
jgi:EAL domain-containing protein (putative c-di-GMP-specific phosphodiesterase class I)